MAFDLRLRFVPNNRGEAYTANCAGGREADPRAIQKVRGSTLEPSEHDI